MSESIHPTHQYACDVSTGRILAAPAVRDACERHIKDFENDEFTFDEAAANRVFEFFETRLVIPQADGALAPFRLLPWQHFVLGNLYGWKRANGYRRFRQAYVETAKGSGKSPMGGGLGLYSIVGDLEFAAEAYCIARTADQALVTFRMVASMVRNSPSLGEMCHIRGGLDRPELIAFHQNESFFKRVASDTMGKGHSGSRPSFALLDEYHEHDSSAMLDFYRAGTKNRKQSLILIITNAGADTVSPCGEEHDYACEVAAGDTEDDAYFSYVAGIDDTDDIDDEAVWPKANPGLPMLPGTEYLSNELARARGIPSKKALVSRLNFCRWGGGTETPWFEREAWIACETEEPPDETRLKLAPCFLGLDLALKNDLCSGMMIWSVGTEDEPRYWGRSVSWTAGNTMVARGQQDRIPYGTWAEQGYLIAPKSNVVPFAVVARWIREVMGEYDVRGLAYDPWKIEELKAKLADYGIEVERNPYYVGTDQLFIAPHAQGFLAGAADPKEDRLNLYMPGSMQALEDAVLEQTLTVEYSPVLRFGVLGAVPIEDASGNRRLSKTKAKSKIDPCMALVFAMGLATAEMMTAPDIGVDDLLIA